MTILFTQILGFIFWVIGAATLCLSAYLLMLMLAATWSRRPATTGGSATRRFAILVPAHNEELMIERLLQSLALLEYPPELFDVFVVADNSTDRTAELARRAGAIVYEREDAERRGKGFALRWLLEHIRTYAAYDAFVVFDADSKVSTGFLRSMDARLESGSQVIQAYYSVLNSTASPVAALRFAALAAQHYVRPLGRSVLGLSVGLKGNGMCFAVGVLERFSWNWFTLAEDVEFHLALVRQGIRVDFAPEAVVLADMPVDLAQAASQNERWERGRLQMLREQIPSLLLDGLRTRSLVKLDAVVEQLIPPLSLPFAAGCVALAGGLLLGTAPLAEVAAGAITGQAAYLLSSLVAVRAPRQAYIALGYAPVYIGWKLALYARALITQSNPGWVRTARIAASQGTAATRS